MKPSYSKYIEHWSIDQDFVFLNHGSFGACPIAILERQSELRKRLESQPMRFMTRELEKLLNESKEKLANFIHAKTENIVFVKNATTGVNTVLKSLKFDSRDEILTCNHIYPAVANTLKHLNETTGVQVKIAKIPFQLQSNQQIIDALMELKSERTKLLVIDHISSPTGILFPVDEIAGQFKAYGIETLVDGAHAPGTVTLNLEESSIAYYTGNCHKWICSPKSAAFLYVRPDLQNDIHPLSTSLMQGSEFSFEQEFYWQGTDDPTAYICVGDSIDFMHNIFPDGWEGIMKHNHELAIDARTVLCKELNIAASIPEYMLANLASMHLPDTNDERPTRFNQFDGLQNRLYHEYKIEAFITYWPEYPKRLLRISPQIYNSIEQYVQLSNKINEIIDSH
jgi:isopenicillin-N epimerase